MAKRLVQGAAAPVWIVDEYGNPVDWSGGGGGGIALLINNGPGAAAVNIQDGGNSLTVDQGAGGLSAWLVALTASELHIGEVGGNTIVVGDETTRPADVLIYAAGDAVSATVSDTATTVLRSLAVARITAGSGYLTKFRLWTDQAACVARFRVHFYTVAAPTGPVVGDNVQMTLLYLNKAQRIGTVDMPAMATGAAGSTAANGLDCATRLAFKCAAADLNLYYRLETLDIFTPASAQKFYLEVASENN